MRELLLLTIVGAFTHNCRGTRPRTWFRLGVLYDGTLQYAAHNSIRVGTVSVVCQFCRAKRWHCERPGLCCVNGKVVLPALEHPPAPLQSLLSSVNLDESKQFFDQIIPSLANSLQIQPDYKHARAIERRRGSWAVLRPASAGRKRCRGA